MGKDLMALIEQIQSLEKQVADLEKRKNNLSVEIDSITAEVRKELETEYAKKTKDLEITYSSRLARLEQEKVEIQKDKAFVVEQDAENIMRAKELQEVSELQQQIIRDNIEETLKLETQQASNQAYIASEKKQLAEAQEIIVAETKRLSDESERLKFLSDDIERMKSDLDTREDSISEREREVIANESSLNIKEERLNTLEASVQVNIAATADAKDKADKELLKASAKRQEAEDLLSENQAFITKTKELSDNLSAWRDRLDEKEKKLSEEERVLVLLRRKIEEKTDTLEKLRASIK